MVDDKDLAWEKPAWATGGGGLKKTGAGDKMKGDGNLAKDVTMATQKKEIDFEKPTWTAEPGLANTGKDLKSGLDIARPIGGIKPSGEQ
jgi:hypothetical protein